MLTAILITLFLVIGVPALLGIYGATVDPNKDTEVAYAIFAGHFFWAVVSWSIYGVYRLFV